MSAGAALERGRQAFEHQTWAEAYAQLSAADREAPLEADDLLQLALASLLTGRGSESISTLTRAHERFLAAATSPGFRSVWCSLLRTTARASRQRVRCRGTASVGSLTCN